MLLAWTACNLLVQVEQCSLSNPLCCAVQVEPPSSEAPAAKEAKPKPVEKAAPAAAEQDAAEEAPAFSLPSFLFSAPKIELPEMPKFELPEIKVSPAETAGGCGLHAERARAAQRCAARSCTGRGMRARCTPYIHLHCWRLIAGARTSQWGGARCQASRALLQHALLWAAQGASCGKMERRGLPGAAWRAPAWMTTEPPRCMCWKVKKGVCT